MPSYIGKSIEDKPAWLKRGEKLHQEWHKKLTNNYIPTVEEAIKYINSWIKFHNNQSCPNDRSKTIQEMLDSIQKQDINPNILNDLMMKTEARTINKHGITFLNMHYRSDIILGLRDKVYVRYSLFDLSKIHVYSTKGEFLCVAHHVQKVHPMARVLGTVKDMEEYNRQYKKQQQIKNRLVKKLRAIYPKEELRLLEIESEESNEVLKIEETQEKDNIQNSKEKPKTIRKRKLPPRERQMNTPIFQSDYEKYEWLMSNGTTNPDDRVWLANYIRSDEYQNIYGDENYEKNIY